MYMYVRTYMLYTPTGVYVQAPYRCVGVPNMYSMYILYVCTYSMYPYMLQHFGHVDTNPHAARVCVCTWEQAPMCQHPCLRVLHIPGSSVGLELDPRGCPHVTSERIF